MRWGIPGLWLVKCVSRRDARRGAELCPAPFLLCPLVGAAAGHPLGADCVFSTVLSHGRKEASEPLSQEGQSWLSSEMLESVSGQHFTSERLRRMGSLGTTPKLWSPQWGCSELWGRDRVAQAQAPEPFAFGVGLWVGKVSASQSGYETCHCPWAKAGWLSCRVGGHQGPPSFSQACPSGPEIFSPCHTQKPPSHNKNACT